MLSLSDAVELGRLVVRDWRNGQMDEEGQGLVEYALIIVLIAVVCIGVMTTLGKSIAAVFTTVAGNL